MPFSPRHELLYRKQQLEEKREKQIEENGSQTIEIRHLDTVPGVRFPPPVFNNREVVNPANPQAVYYQFSIETFGWYNIDVLLKEVIGNTKTELSVRITGSFLEKLDVFLIIPEKKIYTKGGLKNDGSGNYVFAYTDGTIYLPLQARAFILGLTENAEGIAFGLQSFTVSSSQTIELELKASSGEIFNKAINSLNIRDIQISVSKIINADSIRKADTVLKNLKEQLIGLEQLRPKNCNCDCGNEGDSWPDEIINESQK